MKSLVVLLLVLALGGAGTWYFMAHRAGPQVTYRMLPVKRDVLLATIESSGTIEPEEVVDIGAQVVGIINSFATDADGKTVDYRSRVNEDMVLAHIDETLFQADVNSTKAALNQAVATKELDEANLGMLQAKLDEATEDWQRASANASVVAANDLAMYKSNFLQAKANLTVGDKTVQLAKAGVDLAQATYDKAVKNLEYCTIRSPVKGVIIDRRVNIGQTVVGGSGLSAPSLFLVAKDLTRIQVWAAVNEADISSILVGRPVTFTVDAYPDRKFTGAVGKIRYNATMSQNVVTYTVEINTDNTDGALIPYLTATVLFEIARHENVLQVPNSALRWMPDSAEEVVPEARNVYSAMVARRLASAAESSGGGKSAGGSGAGRSPGATSRPAKPADRTTSAADHPVRTPDHADGDALSHDRGTVWVREGPLFRPVRVKLGKSDGTYTELLSDELKEAEDVVVGEEHPDENGGNRMSGSSSHGPGSGSGSGKGSK
jgi:HlyD family secretion protein